MQGSRGLDFGVSNSNVGLKGPSGMPTQYAHQQLGDVVWHHADYDPVTNKAKMQLVTTADHKATFPHSGSVAEFEAHTNTKYGKPAAIQAAKGMNAKC
jgi:A nuclease of the HNH/ENDO VII superfamily with conserved WHH